jgi:ribose transport system ATP-binding protein
MTFFLEGFLMVSNDTNVVPALEMRQICKSFPGVRALDKVDLTVYKGEIHAICGENGAGKSTLMKILSGAEQMDTGEILLEGKKVHLDNPIRALHLGISTIYQELNLAPYLTAAENIFLGREPAGTLPGFVNFTDMYRRAEQIIESLGVHLDVRLPVNRLSIAQQQMVEIARAASRESKIIIMDEPSATLTEHELASLFALMRKLKSEGIAIIYISHRLEEIFGLCDRVTVMRDGQLVSTHNVSELDRQQIIRLMVGRELNQMIPERNVPIGDPVLKVEKVSRKGKLKDISLTVRSGEVVGIAGLVGAGRTELAKVIFGADPMDSGEIQFMGKPVHIDSPKKAIEIGIGLVTEDRKAEGLVLPRTVRENITLANLHNISKGGFIQSGSERTIAEHYIKDLSIKTPSMNQIVKNLSGGNQQKVVLAKWLCTQSKFLIFDEPTRGIDVGAKAEIYNLMNTLAGQGVAILMISSDLPEILGMSDRILVMHEGRIAGELMKSEATQEKIMHLATGGR